MEQSVPKRRHIRLWRWNSVFRNVGISAYEDGTACSETSAYPPMKMEQSVPKRRSIRIWRWNRVFRNVGLSAYEDGTECSETSAYKIQIPGELPRRKHTTFRTRRKFEIKKSEVPGQKRASVYMTCIVRTALGLNEDLKRWVPRNSSCVLQRLRRSRMLVSCLSSRVNILSNNGAVCLCPRFRLHELHKLC